MKSIFKIFACALALGMTAVAASFPVAADSTYIKGDANGDGIVNIHDITTIQRVLAQLESDPKGAIKRRANVDGGSLSVTDATAIQRYLAEYEDDLKIGTVVHYDEYELPFVPN